jgi:hypothetical protein
MLLCDPRLTVFPSTVQMPSNNSLIVTNNLSSSALGNIDFNTSVQMFSSMEGILQTPLVNVGEDSFLAAISPFFNNNSGGGLPILASADSIAANFDSLYVSMMKAFSYGYINSTLTSTVSAQASIVVGNRLVLIASKQIWIVTMALVGLVVVLVATSVAASEKDRQPFNLENITRVVENTDMEPESEELISEEKSHAASSSWDPKSLYESHRLLEGAMNDAEYR